MSLIIGRVKFVPAEPSAEGKRVPEAGGSMTPKLSRDHTMLLVIIALGLLSFYLMTRVDEERHVARYACDVIVRLRDAIGAEARERDDQSLRETVRKAIFNVPHAKSQRRITVDEAADECQNERREHRPVLLGAGLDPSSDPSSPFYDPKRGKSR